MELRAADIRAGMVLGGRRSPPRLVVGYVPRVPLVFDYWGIRLLVRDLVTGEVEQAVYQATDMVEIDELSRRTLVFVCQQGGELILLDPGTSAVYSVPERCANGSPELWEPSAHVVVTFFEVRPLWVLGVGKRDESVS